MKAQISVNVRTRQQAQAIETALSDDCFWAVAVIVGILTPETDRARRRILAYVQDYCDEAAAQK